MTRIFIVFILIAIIAALGTAMFYLVRDPGSSRRTFQALALRVSLSVGLIIFLLVAWLLGWIKPHGVYPAGVPVAPSDRQQYEQLRQEQNRPEQRP